MRRCASNIVIGACAAAVLLVSNAATAASSPVERLDPSLVIETWGTREGLPHNSIGSIARTPEGYLWLATQLGLVRFDGARFVLFDSETEPAIVRNHIQSLAVGRNGSLWIGTYGGGLLRWARGVGIERVVATGLPADLVVEAVYEDRDGVLWVGSQGRGLFRVEGGTARRLTMEDGLPSNTVAAICGDRHGGLWISPMDTLTSSSGPLTRLADGRSTAFSMADGLPGETIQSLWESASGDVYVATDGGLARWAGDGFSIVATAADGLPSSNVWGVTRAPDGVLWVATDGGLARLDGRQAGTVIDPSFGVAGIPMCILADGEGSVWIGRWDSGLIRVRPAVFTLVGRREGLAHDVVWAVDQARDGAVWVATEGGVTRFTDRDLRSWTVADGLPHDPVRSIAEDREGGLWLGTQGGGVCRFYRGVIDVLDLDDGLPDAVVYATAEDRRGVMWVGTAGGLARLPHKLVGSNGGEWPAVLGEESISVMTTRDGLSSDVVRSIVEDRRGRLLVGTNQGLDVVEDGRARPFVPELVGDFVLSVHEDDEGVLWVATNGGGLVAIIGDRVVRFGGDSGLRIDVVYKVVEDDFGSLWLSSNGGISRVEKAALLAWAAGDGGPVSARSFDARDGLRTAECNGGSQSSGCRARDGSVWFPTMSGVAIVYPGSLPPDPPPPAVLIESVVVDGRSYPASSMVNAPPGRGELEIRFTALDLLVPSRLRFRYQLEGFDDDWVDADQRRSARYTSLPPGNFRFRVASGVRGDGWGAPGAALELNLAPRLYQTKGFRLVCGLAVAVGGWLAHRFRVRHLRARAAALEREVDAAVAELKVLGGMLPICASCKKIRDDSGSYVEIEEYISGHSEAVFSHGLCGECVKKHYPDEVFD